jgi:hypothetical protein
LGTGTWRTLFIIEGIFPIFWVIVWLWGVADTPSRASWLTGAERDAIIAKLARLSQLAADNPTNGWFSVG